MDNALDQFMTMGTAIFAVAIVIIVFFIRKIVETAMPSLKKKADENTASVTYSTTFARWYQQVILYAIPVVSGGLLGLINIPYFFPEDIATSGGRVFYGCVVGWFSSAAYKVVKRALAKRGVELPSASVNPPPPV